MNYKYKIWIFLSVIYRIIQVYYLFLYLYCKKNISHASKAASGKLLLYVWRAGWWFSLHRKVLLMMQMTLKYNYNLSIEQLKYLYFMAAEYCSTHYEYVRATYVRSTRGSLWVARILMFAIKLTLKNNYKGIKDKFTQVCDYFWLRKKMFFIGRRI